MRKSRLIPIWIHLPWFLISLIGTIVAYQYDTPGWIWRSDVRVMYRLPIFALSIWQILSTFGKLQDHKLTRITRKKSSANASR